MPTLALVLCLVWFLALFVLRSWLQWRRTGSTGIVGFHGRPGSLPWWAGVGASVGLVLAVVAPLAALRGWPGGGLLFAVPEVHLAGAILAVLGIGGGLVAQLDMGDSWRVGVDESAQTRLVTDGLFRFVRNPIFTFVLLSAVGIVLVVPNPLAVVALGATVFGIEAQVRAVEEPYLQRTHGEAYGDYAARVGRFLPGIGRMVDG